MATKTSTVAIVVGILQLTFGVFGICGSVIMLPVVQQKMAELQAQQAGVQKPPFTQADLDAFVEQKHPTFHTITTARAIAGLVLSLMMIVSGIGLLRMQPWGRILALVYAGCSIVIRIAGSLYTFTVFIPAVNEFTAQFEPQAGATQQAHLLATAMRFNATLAAVFFAVALLYPILVLILLLMPGVGAAFRAKSRGEEPEDYDDRYREN
jgi:hypothetical protein